MLLKRFLYAQLSGAVYVTHELMLVNEFGLRNKISKITIGNAINLRRIKPLSPRREHQLALFFVGTPNQPWHGVSELIEFGREHPKINIHIVGERDIEELPNVFFYGKLNPSKYRSVANKCVAGVGSLNLVANQMEEASPLKVREYLALGLPVILKYKDTDLDSTEPFVLQLPSDGRPLTEFTTEIEIFLDEWANKRVAREKIANLDIGIKEMNRLEFFEDVRMNRRNKIKRRGQR
jgi:glycosyltransferase involved in cell wall biosynthesis